MNVRAFWSSVVCPAGLAGENVGVRNITGGVFSAASANYSAPSLTGSPTLTISQASLTGAIANQSKVYGADDPTLRSEEHTFERLAHDTAVWRLLREDAIKGNAI